MAQTTVVAVDSDRLYPRAPQCRDRRRGAGRTRAPITSPYGHDGFLIEIEQVGQVSAAPGGDGPHRRPRGRARRPPTCTAFRYRRAGQGRAALPLTEEDRRVSIVVGYIPTREGRAALRRAAVECELRRVPRWSSSQPGQRQAYDDARHRPGSRPPSTRFGAPGRRRRSGRGAPARARQGRAEDLIEVADASHAELIVIGLRRRTPVGKLILGSNAQRILLDADLSGARGQGLGRGRLTRPTAPPWTETSHRLGFARRPAVVALIMVDEGLSDGPSTVSGHATDSRAGTDPHPSAPPPPATFSLPQLTGLRMTPVHERCRMSRDER